MSGEIQRALATLFRDGGVVELRALTDYLVHSGYFDNLDVLAEKAANLDTLPEVAGIYVTLNTVDPALLSRRANRVKMNLGRKDSTTSDADVVRRRWLPIDLDPVRPSGVSSTDEEHQAAIVRAAEIAAYLGKEQGWPAPIMADSGNGAHLLYRIDLPNGDESMDLVKGCLMVLDTLFSDGAVSVDAANFNAARIWKLYGTTSRKGDNTSDRPHRQACLLDVPDKLEVVPVEQLRHLSGLLPRNDPDPGQRTKGRGLDLHKWLNTHGIGIRSEKPWQGGTLFVLDECPFSSAHRDGAFAIQFPSGAIHAGCQHASCGGGSQRWPELRERYEPRKREKRERGSISNTAPAPSPPSPPVSSAANIEARSRAAEVLRSGDPLGFLLDVFHREHVGDRVVAECLVLSVASQSVTNTQGLHVAISGNSGKGKTHACRAMLNLLPEQFKLKGTVSDKALYYHPLQPGTVLLFDDVSLSEDLQEILKSATASFREPIEHRTLTSDRQVRICTIPERCVWWLAKVELAGDDQVMNRMLCVWIDDSNDQDVAVLAHLKDAEAREAIAGEDPDVAVCRGIWELVKEQVFHARVPFAPRIHFSTAQNRRNPGMLFDLIKCHARFFFLQRERDEHRSVIATREDFEYARRLFLDLTGDTGAQETKQTRNEAAALESIAKMGLEVFTIKQLQEALGLSYHQVYRLLKGYRNGRGYYTGILDKCPAVSYIDATVAEDIYGMEVKHREHYFSFDIGLYKNWTARAEIWLEDEIEEDKRRRSGPSGENDDDTITPALPGQGVNEEDAEFCSESENNEEDTERGTSSDTSFHHLPGAHSMDSGAVGASSCACVTGDGENQTPCSVIGSPIAGSRLQNSSSFSTGFCKDVQRKAISAKGKKPFRINPLPGLLDHRDFKRVKVVSGRCDICHEGSAIFRCAEKDVTVCERCYARMVREWNEEKGVN
ncbi:MAG: hypothetical protein PHG80_09565 [Methanoregulaceae archaeon]|nr:hypothetical protein [Methanoregulaceae archaeon]